MATIIAVSDRKPALDRDDAYFWREWRIRLTEVSERTGIFSRDYRDCAYFVESRRIDEPVRDDADAQRWSQWKPYACGRSWYAAVEDLSGDTSFMRARSTHDIHADMVARHVRRERMAKAVFKLRAFRLPFILTEKANREYNAELGRRRLRSVASGSSATPKQRERLEALRSQYKAKYLVRIECARKAYDACMRRADILETSYSLS